jgi:hypothetical protein
MDVGRYDVLKDTHTYKEYRALQRTIARNVMDDDITVEQLRCFLDALQDKKIQMNKILYRK